jgi:hypothetical protein
MDGFVMEFYLRLDRPLREILRNPKTVNWRPQPETKVRIASKLIRTGRKQSTESLT